MTLIVVYFCWQFLCWRLVRELQTDAESQERSEDTFEHKVGASACWFASHLDWLNNKHDTSSTSVIFNESCRELFQRLNSAGENADVTLVLNIVIRRPVERAERLGVSYAEPHDVWGKARRRSKIKSTPKCAIWKKNQFFPQKGPTRSFPGPRCGSRRHNLCAI